MSTPTKHITPAAKTDPDKGLVVLAQQGDETALAALYQKYFDGVYRFCYWQTNQAQDAEDIAQEVFVALVRGIAQFNFQASFRNYLYTIAKYQIARWLRQKYRLPQVHYDEFLQLITDTDDWVDPDNATLKTQQVKMLLQNLKQRDRRVVIAKYLKGLTYQEIARAMHLTATNVKVICSRSLKKLALLVKTAPR